MKNRRPKRKLVLLLSFLLLSLIFLCITVYACYVRTENQIERARQLVISEEGKIRYAIESRISTVRALEIYVISQNGILSDFDEIAAMFYDDDPALRSIQLAPNGVVTHAYMYPKEDKKFLDHDLFADPERRDDVEKARDFNQIILSGVLELHQGGKGIIIRNPIFLDDENGQKSFWGFSMVVFNVPEVFNMEHLNLLTSEHYYYRLWKYAPFSEEIQVVVENTDQPLNTALRADIEISDTTWYLDIMPQEGWLPRNLFVALISIFTVILVLATAAISSHMKVREVLYSDSLLGIGNANALTTLFQKLPQQTLKNMYLVVFDIDKFKEFNYLYGEESGDRLLQYIVRVFQEELPDVKLFRYYSDYFVTLLECNHPDGYEAKIKQVLKRFSNDIETGIIQPFDISAGIRKIEKDEPLQRIISDALIARGTIKGNYLKHHAVYSDDIRLRRIDYMEMESSFAKALRTREFRVYYQPKYDIRSGKIIGAEALTRWIKTDGSIISPSAFIPCLEESRQIILLDEYILKEVCRQMREMRADGLEVRPVSVNLSRIHLRHPDVLPKISAIIEESGIQPSNLSFEITESALLEESIPMKAILSHLHELGCKVDMDDYGVGASNLDALLSNHFDTLKLDKSIVDRIGDERSEDLIRSTTELVRKWGMEVLAEGVEDASQAERLMSLGCFHAQGFYYSKPVSEAEYRQLLEAAG